MGRLKTCLGLEMVSRCICRVLVLNPDVLVSVLRSGLGIGLVTQCLALGLR